MSSHTQISRMHVCRIGDWHHVCSTRASRMMAANINKLEQTSVYEPCRSFHPALSWGPMQWGRKNSTCQCLCDKRTCQACQVRRERPPLNRSPRQQLHPSFQCFESKIRVLTCMVDHNMVAKDGVSMCTKAVQMAAWMSLTNGAPVGQLHSKCLGMMMDSCPELFLPLKPVWKENKSLSHPFNLNTYRKQWKVKTSSCFLHKSGLLTIVN